MSYDKSKKTTGEDVKKEFKDVVDAMTDQVSGNVAEQAREAVAATADYVADKAVDAVAGVKKWFQVKLGYPLHDGSQGVTITQEPTLAVENRWIEIQKEAGLVVEVAGPEASVSTEV